MSSIQVSNGKNIRLYGSNAVIQSEKSIIEDLQLTGNESKDRLIIQQCIDDNNLKSDILYDGNTVYPFKKIVKAYRKLQKSGTLEKLTNEMYHFFTNACGDIAHYDIGGFIAYYNNSFQELENTICKNCFTTSWHTDLDRIFKELKIGREYFPKRESIDINVISLKQLKSLLKDCGWEVITNDNRWTLKKSDRFDNLFSFEIDASSKKVSNIVFEVQNYCKNFDANEYIEITVENRETSENVPSIRSIVNNANIIESLLKKLSTDVLYKCRVESELLDSSMQTRREFNNMDFDLELER